MEELERTLPVKGNEGTWTEKVDQGAFHLCGDDEGKLKGRTFFEKIWLTTSTKTPY